MNILKKPETKIENILFSLMMMGANQKRKIKL